MVGSGRAGKPDLARLRFQRVVVARQVDRWRDQSLGERVPPFAAAQQRVCVEWWNGGCRTGFERVEREGVSSTRGRAPRHRGLDDAQLDLVGAEPQAVAIAQIARAVAFYRLGF